MADNLPVPSRPSQYGVQKVCTHAEQIRPFVRMESATLTTAVRQAGLPIELAELCGGLLASVVDDLVSISELAPSNFERSKRLERVLACTEEPAVHALRIAMAASPINARACARHWDAICDRGERGKLAWLLGMQTDNAAAYGKRMEKMR